MSKTKSGSGKRTALTVLCVVLALVLAIMLGVTIYAEYLLNKINYVDNSVQQETLTQEELQQLEQQFQEEDAQNEEELEGPVLNEEDVDLGDGADVEIGAEDSIVNILLIGQDTRTGARARSDSMILCTFNKDQNTLTLTSFMRDLYVKIPGYKNTRINAAYAYGGMALLDETLYENFGIVVDGNVEVDFNQFASIIDLLGGVEMEITSNEASFINTWATDSHLKAGTRLLTGEQALWYARDRKDVDGDFSRTNRQRKLLVTLIDEYKSSSVTTMIGLLEKILPMVTTDLEKDEIVSYVTELFPLLTSCEIVTQRIPVDGGYYNAVINGAQVLVPDMDMNIQALVDSLSNNDEGVG